MYPPCPQRGWFIRCIIRTPCQHHPRSWFIWKYVTEDCLWPAFHSHWHSFHPFFFSLLLNQWHYYYYYLLPEYDYHGTQMDDWIFFFPTTFICKSAYILVGNYTWWLLHVHSWCTFSEMNTTRMNDQHQQRSSLWLWNLLKWPYQILPVIIHFYRMYFSATAFFPLHYCDTKWELQQFLYTRVCFQML